MLFAISSTTTAEVEALLGKFPSGTLQLNSRYLSHEQGISIGLDYTDELHSPYAFGPLWALGERVFSNETTKLLLLFQSRGENINEQCGPYGTVLHSALIEQIGHNGRPGAGGHARCRYQLEPMLRMLLNYGADINTSGPQGNALEFLWRKANTEHEIKLKWVFRYQEVIELLIDLGATNSVRDPNGLIPTKDFMLGFGHNWLDYLADLYFYIHGTYPEEINQSEIRTHKNFPRDRGSLSIHFEADFQAAGVTSSSSMRSAIDQSES